MRRWFVLIFAVLLPLQFAWSAASAYCQHETGEQQSSHFGHHLHAHKLEAKSASSSKLAADADCASCHAAGAAMISASVATRDFAIAVQTVASLPSRRPLPIGARASARPPAVASSRLTGETLKDSRLS